ncbi:hypothetical protein SAMN04489722_11343 [Algibacter lectus]|uniref:hypothetical protein n=1 Tax=Algibacter lectus TaxID=221126 RepID=UPI0008EC666D|nr:hypothetical protein [Algibacter lectus]SFD61332.1 hypothetical protein SAMN04489722_11343 [Algibacter lectus]
MYSISNIGRAVAILSFMIGTTLFSFFLYFGETFIPIGVGLGFIGVAITVNAILLVSNLIASLIYETDRYNNLKTCGIILMNIPIAILYFYIIISLNDIRL